MPKNGKPQSGGAASESRKTRPKAEYRVIVDLPDPLPITEAEIDLLERELADFLAELLRA